MGNQKKIRIALAEDHQVLRQGMVTLLSNEESFNLVFDVGDGAELIEKLNKNEIDIIILDVEMPIIDGLEALKIIEQKFENIRVIMLSSFYENEMIYQAISLGARGFLPKHTDIENVISAIKRVQEDEYYFDEKVTPKLISLLKKNGIIYPQFEVNQLSKRELDVLPLICQGLKNKEIAQILFISERTVENHRKNLFSKTKSPNSFGLFSYAIKNGLIKLT